MHKVTKATLLVLSLSFLLVSCGEESNADLTGTWKTTSDAIQMEATIQDHELVIDWVETSFTALYWKGSFVDTADGGSTILSIGDTDAMDNSLMGSLDDTKEFVFDKGKISFELTVFGVTQTIYMEKVSDV